MGPTLKEILHDAGEIVFDLADPADLPAVAEATLMDERDTDAESALPRRRRAKRPAWSTRRWPL